MRIPRCELAQAQPCKMGLAHKADKRDLTEAFKAMPQEIPFATDKKRAVMAVMKTPGKAKPCRQKRSSRKRHTPEPRKAPSRA